MCSACCCDHAPRASAIKDQTKARTRSETKDNNDNLAYQRVQPNLTVQNARGRERAQRQASQAVASVRARFAAQTTAHRGCDRTRDDAPQPATIDDVLGKAATGDASAQGEASAQFAERSEEREESVWPEGTSTGEDG